MAGHSKWANIKHRKARADKVKGKIFSRIIKEIISAVKQGGAESKNNPRLRLVLLKAKSANVPLEAIERNIKKASSADQQDFIEMTYELYGFGGVGVIAEVMTDNKNRIASDMRIATNKQGGTIANPGSVLFNFDQKGIIHILKGEGDEDSLFLAATEAGADDFEVTEEGYVIITPADLLYVVKEKLDPLVKIESAELERIPKHTVSCSEDDEKANLSLIEYLEELDDVDAVYHTMKIKED